MELDRDIAAQRLIASDVDRSHAPGTDHLVDLETIRQHGSRCELWRVLPGDDALQQVFERILRPRLTEIDRRRLAVRNRIARHCVGAYSGT